MMGWALNVLGMRPAMWIMYATGVLVLIPIVVFAAAPLFSDAWSMGNLHWDLAASGENGWRTALFKVPGRAMSLDLVVNVILILFVGEALAVIVAGIVGYLLCHILSLTGFLNLRRDEPDAPRPIKLGRQWVYIAALVAVMTP